MYDTSMGGDIETVQEQNEMVGQSFGQKKLHGGDYWRVHIKQGSMFSMAVQLQDGGDGCYHGYFTLNEPGNYTLHCTLEYSECDGLRDPPTGWFQKGTYQGLHRKSVSLDHFNDFINEQLPPVNLHITDLVDHPVVKLKINDSLNTTCGYWKNSTFVSILSTQNKSSNNRKTSNNNGRSERNGILVVYGDSSQRRFYWSISRKPLCTELFKKCHDVYAWNYKHFPKENMYRTDGKPFNRTKALVEMRSSMIQDEMFNPRSVFLINFGLHTTMNLNMDEAMDLFQGFLGLVSDMRALYGGKLGRIVWKNTMPPHLEHSNLMNSWRLRFLTKHRVLLWNSYTSEQLGKKTDIQTLDIHDLAISSPDIGFLDFVHHEHFVFKKAEEKLKNFVEEIT